MNKHLTLKELPYSERPYEKCEHYGASALSDAELLAVIIKTGTKNERAIDLANHILKLTEPNGLAGINYMSIRDFTKIKGIGRVKAIQLLCIAELTKRMARSTREEGLRLLSPESVANYYMQQMRHLKKEKIVLVMLDTKNKFLKDLTISTGTIDTSIISPREIFISALQYEAANIILLHNHPSGDPSPSHDDVRTTKRIKECGTLIGIELMDHIIIGDNKYVSLKERGVL